MWWPKTTGIYLATGMCFYFWAPFWNPTDSPKLWRMSAGWLGNILHTTRPVLCSKTLETYAIWTTLTIYFEIIHRVLISSLSATIKSTLHHIWNSARNSMEIVWQKVSMLLLILVILNFKCFFILSDLLHRIV